MGVIMFNGISSSDVGFFVERAPSYEIPERKYDVTKVPGRNGDVVVDTGAYENVERVYDISIGALGADFASLAHKISNWLYSGYGYLRLEDSYEPDYYKLARYSGGDIITNILNQAGRISLKFDRRPERFLKTGETPITITLETTLRNPTQYPAKPIIKVYGTDVGTINIDGFVCELIKFRDGMTIDCDLEDVYAPEINLNDHIKVTKGLPVLRPNVEIPISFTGGITHIEIIPRWWTI